MYVSDRKNVQDVAGVTTDTRETKLTVIAFQLKR